MCINWHFIYIHAYALLHLIRYTRCICVDVKHAVLESTHKAVSVDIPRRWKDLLKQPKTRPKVGRAQDLGRINTNLVLPPGKPRCMTYYFKL